MQVKITGLVITFNEEEKVETCIRSLKKVCDEIVIVDSFSTDRTKEICESLGVRFISNDFKGHIEQKNFAITQANYPHVLSLDADEALSDELAESILEIKSDWKADAYSMNRLTRYINKWIKHGNWYPDMKSRLWDTSKGKWKGRNPHDKFILNEKGKVIHLEGDILHYSIDSITDHLNTINKFSDISAKAMYESGQGQALIKMLVNPFVKFIKSYIIKLGFLDGKYGFIVSWYSSYATFLKYYKLHKLKWKTK
ncbi:MAG TPA: glycosyltransferase family 2 protein [Bacteroidetes bacterium]|nr:glycosyltransferase family 2 protein [Bacteroidota bacterium]